MVVFFTEKRLARILCSRRYAMETSENPPSSLEQAKCESIARSNVKMVLKAEGSFYIQKQRRPPAESIHHSPL